MKRPISSSLFLSLSIVFLLSAGCKEFFYPEQKKAPVNESTIDETGTGMKVTKRADGSIVSRVPYKNSKRHGQGVSFYDGGEKQLEIGYKDGKKHGLEKYYYESGKLFRISLYREGTIDSIQVFYHKNGKLMAEVPYTEGLLCAGTKEFKDDGTELSMPEIITKVDDQVSINGNYYLELSMNRRVQKVAFFYFQEGADKDCPALRFPIEDVNGSIRHTIHLERETFIMGEVTLGAEFTSYQRVKHFFTDSFVINASRR